jgi:hypothetical protein
MLQENKQIQIAIYSALLKDGVWPAAGYLTLPNATIRTLAHDEKSFLQPQFTPDEINGDHPSSRLWSDVQSLWMWRWAQLHEGYIEITTEKVDEDNQLAVFKVPEGLSFELKGGVPEYNYGKILTGTGRKAG